MFVNAAFNFRLLVLVGTLRYVRHVGVANGDKNPILSKYRTSSFSLVDNFSRE